MVTSPQAVANVFLELAKADGKELSNLKLQKLVFLAHGFSLALFGKPLQDRNIHAWRYGPVIPNLYKSLEKYGADKVTEPIETYDQVGKPSDECNIIKSVWKHYGIYTGSQLTTLTHDKDTPWSKTWNSKQYSIISDELIEDYYKKTIEHGKYHGR